MDIAKIILKDPLYPALLRDTIHPPKSLYVKGNAQVLTKPMFAIVGTRKASGEGLEMARKIAKELASAGLVIVSGLAQGIDGSAHKGALEGGGQTLGVLGSSLEERFFFPSSHIALARQMIETGGAIVSEHEKNYPALRRNFIARNRIISGLTCGVLVVEAPLKSGALITAQFAKQQRRPVFAVPGSPFSKNFEGTNFLIKNGGFLAESARDVLEILGKKKLFSPKKRNDGIIHGVWKHENLSNEEMLIFGALQEGQIHIDKLAQKTKVEVPKLLSMLITFELKGLVKNVGGGNYLLVKS